LTGITLRGNLDPVVMRCSADGTEPAALFVGESKQPGSDNAHFQNPLGVACDAQGRLYIADSLNHRIQVFAPDGKYLKTIPVDRPQFVCVHRKTGAIYVMHEVRAQGKSLGRLTKFTSLDQPREEFSVDNMVATAMTVDSWTAQPRLWLGGEKVISTTGGVEGGSGPSVRIYEEQNGTLKEILDFDDVAKPIFYSCGRGTPRIQWL
jgi:hypothetical protein